MNEYPETREEEEKEILKRLQTKMSTEQIASELLVSHSRVLEVKKIWAGAYPSY